jgi:hypothetical protein
MEDAPPVIVYPGRHPAFVYLLSKSTHQPQQPASLPDSAWSIARRVILEKETECGREPHRRWSGYADDDASEVRGSVAAHDDVPAKSSLRWRPISPNLPYLPPWFTV